MARNLRLMHTTYVCFWRCPVLSCSLWFTSELNAKDHIESILLLRVSPEVRPGVVREPGFLRRTVTGVPGVVDGLSVSTPVRSGAEEYLHHYNEPGVRSSTSLLPSRRRPVTTLVRRITGDLRRAKVTHHADASSGRRLRRHIVRGKFDAVISTSCYSGRNSTGGIRDGHQYAGRCFPRYHDETDNAGEPSSSTPGGRSARCLHTTTRDVQTVCARPMYRQRESPITDKSTTPGPAVPTLCRNHLLVAGDRSSSHTGGRQQGFTLCTTELGRAAAVCR